MWVNSTNLESQVSYLAHLALLSIDGIIMSFQTAFSNDSLVKFPRFLLAFLILWLSLIAFEQFKILELPQVNPRQRQHLVQLKDDRALAMMYL